jgi:hypothetical protein
MSDIRLPGRLAQNKLFLRAAILGLLIALLGVSAAGCFSLATQATPEIRYYDFSTKITGTTGQAAPTGGQQAGLTPAPTETLSTEAFQKTVRQLLLAGLQKRQKAINLDIAVEPQGFAETDSQKVIDQVFAIYQAIYLEYPEFYYLNGSINVNYSIARGAQPVLTGMTVKPLYWEITADLTNAQLDDLIRQVDDRATAIAQAISSQTAVPWQQLQLLHDRLVSGIAYDTSGNVETNQVISALLDGKTLCQGYARSYQLVAEKLGFDVLLISGETDGIGHVWDLVKLAGQYYHVDVTHDDPTPDAGATAPVEHVHFLRSDQAMQVTHTWTHADYPACPTDGAQYYRENGLTAASRSELKSKINQFCQSLDYRANKTSLLEVLDTSGDPPDDSALEKIVKNALLEASGGSAVHFRYQVSKSVILVEITTGG